jgi:hypothetical protein
MISVQRVDKMVKGLLLGWPFNGFFDERGRRCVEPSLRPVFVRSDNDIDDLLPVEVPAVSLEVVDNVSQ